MSKKVNTSIVFIILFIGIFTYCVIRFFGESFTMVNVFAAIGCAIGVIGFILKLIKDAKNKKENHEKNNQSI